MACNYHNLNVRWRDETLTLQRTLLLANMFTGKVH
jgi:hypothetical protein